MVQKRLQPSKMDPAIWSKLPEELLEHVLSFLPLKTILNLRSTCKHFNSLIFSPSFVSKYSSSSSSFSSFLLLSHPQCSEYFPLYDSSLGTWRKLALPHPLLLPCAAPASASSTLLPCSAAVSASSTLLSSSNGLFCFSLPHFSSFLVCNILAKSARIIDFPTFPFAFEMLTLVSTPFGYKIFMLFTKSFSNLAFVYDSRDRFWSKFEGFPSILSHNNHQEGVFCDGSLYFTSSEPFSIVRFDLDSGKWDRANDMLPNQLTFVRLVSNGEGKLYLIGGVGRNGISRSMKLWELGDGGEWIEMESLPDMMCKKFMSVCYHNYGHVYCFWHQEMICVCCYTWPEILYYKVSRRIWHWLPKCPSLPEKSSCGFRWFSFIPDLYALV